MNEKISRVLDIPIEITAILGRTKMSLNEILELGRGSLLEIDTLENQEVEILINGKKVAYGQVVISNKNFGIKITEVLEPEDLVNSLK